MRKSPLVEEKFDMGSVRYDLPQKNVNPYSAMINKAANQAFGAARRQGQTLTLMKVIQLVMMIISIKLMYVTFKAQY